LPSKEPPTSSWASVVNKLVSTVMLVFQATPSIKHALLSSTRILTLTLQITLFVVTVMGRMKVLTPLTVRSSRTCVSRRALTMQSALFREMWATASTSMLPQTSTQTTGVPASTREQGWSALALKMNTFRTCSMMSIRLSHSKCPISQICNLLNRATNL